MKEKSTARVKKGNQLPFVSIIIPAFNEEKNIVDCLNGVNQVDYPVEKIEVIVVDNGSADMTRANARNLGADVYEVIDVTVAELRNFGAQHSSGEVLAFLDADCIPPTNWLIESLNVLSDPKNIVVGGMISLPDGQPVAWVEQYWVTYLSSKFNSEFVHVDSLSSFCFLVKKTDFDSVNGFNTSLTTCEDYDLGYRLRALGEIIINTRIAVIHLGNAKSLVEFWRRQLWQGRSNFQNVLSHKFTVNELPSIVIPILFVCSGVSLLVSCGLEFNGRWKAVLLFMVLSFIIPSLVTLKFKRARTCQYFFGYWIIWCVYLAARGVGMLFPRIK